jgi:hypothetical protein
VQLTKGKKPRKAAVGQKEMLLAIGGKRTAKGENKKAYSSVASPEASMKTGIS